MLIKMMWYLHAVEDGFKINVVLIIFMCVCLCVEICTRVQVSMRARDVASFASRITSYKSPDVHTENIICVLFKSRTNS